MSKCHIGGNHVSRLISVNVMLATFVTVPRLLFILRRVGLLIALWFCVREQPKAPLAVVLADSSWPK